jgi:hypothetical protein
MAPFQTFGFVEMIRDKAGFLVGKPQVVQQYAFTVGIDSS